MTGKREKERKPQTLLFRTLTKFLLCTGVVFLLTAPLFYMLTKCFYAEDMIDIIESVERGHGIPPLDLERDIIAGMMLQFLLIFLVISIALFITMRFTTHRLWSPFDDMLRRTERFNLAHGVLPRFAETDIIEFNRLACSLEQLMERDRNAFRIQKEFTENASHELQTPLAVICGKLDLLMQENLNGRQMRLVSDLCQLTMRMSHLNRNLLLLAKIDNAQYAVTEEVDIAALLADTFPMYDVLRNGIPIEVDDRRSVRRKPLHANPVLLESLLKNLIVNAIRHSAPGGKVKIHITDNRLAVCNAAPEGEGALNPETLFHRFRSTGVRNKGNGLGLAIVKAVCDYHGWTVKYGFADGQHCFTVQF